MRRLLVPVVLALATLSSACSQEAGVDFELKTQPPLDTVVTQDQIRIYAGIAVAVDAIPLSGGEPSDQTTVALESQDVNVLGIDPSVTAGIFVLYGVAPGAVNVRVFMDNEPVGDIPATVVQQGQSP